MHKLENKDILKVWEKGKERFVPGHRTCAGCFIPTIARTVLGNLPDGYEPVVGIATGCMEVTTTLWPHSSYNVPAIHNTFENVAATLSGAEAAYQVMKKNGYDKKLKFVAFGGDGGTVDIGFASLSGMLERGHDILYVLYDNEAYMNCLALSSLIYTKKGLKRIIDLKVGDQVYVFDNKKHSLDLKKVSGIFDNGTQEVFEVITDHNNIKATSNHPFLCLERNGRGKQNKLVWKPVEKLTKKDEVVVLKKISKGKSYVFPKIKISKKGDYKVNKINPFVLPKKSSEELMLYLGLFTGDGWIRPEKGEIGFALPENTKGREKLFEVHEKIFGSNKHSEDKMYVYYQSVNIANFIDSLGIKKGAKNKTIPSWIFTLPIKQRQAFVDGLLLSDGYIYKKTSMRYVSASYDLLERLRFLLQTMDYRVGKIHWKKTLKGKQIVKRKLLKDTYEGYICFSKKPSYNFTKYSSQGKYSNFLRDNDSFEMVKIKKVVSKGFEPTLDLRVEGEHNFIANGYVVHNTGIQRSGATPIYASTTTTPAGKVVPGKSIFKKDIMKVVAGHNIPYVAQANPFYLDDFVYKIRKAFSIEGPKFLDVLMPCTLGWKFPQHMTPEIARLATETNFWPLYEIENGKYKLNYEPKEKLSVEEFLKYQGRYKHLFKPRDDSALNNIQKHIDDNFRYIKRMSNL